MSSILNALKKLEEETVAESGLQPRIRRKAGAGHRVRFFLADYATPLLVAVLAVGLGAAGWFGYDRYTLVSKEHQVITAARGTGQPAAPAAKPAAEPAPPATAPQSAPVKTPATGPMAARMPQAPPPQTIPAPTTPKRMPSPEPLPERAAAPVPVQPPATMPEPAVAAPAPVRPVAPRVPVPPIATESPVSEQSEQAMPGTEVFETFTDGSIAEPEPPAEIVAAGPEFPLLDNSALTLQAISWSSDPGKRIAVINGNICREGGRVDKFTIREINPEDVIVNDGKATWTLPFQLK